MLKLIAVVNKGEQVRGQYAQKFLLHHPYVGMFFCGIVMPLIILLTVGVLCYSIMLPISFFMGWL